MFDLSIAEKFGNRPGSGSGIICALSKAFENADIEAMPPTELLGVDHHHSLILDSFAEDNARGLYDLADRIVTRNRLWGNARRSDQRRFFQALPTPTFPWPPGRAPVLDVLGLRRTRKERK